MTKRRVLGLVSVLLLTGCASSDQPVPTDVVRSGSAAIELASTKDCLRPPSGKFTGRWSAALHNGIWDVMLREDGDSSRCPAYRDQIVAATGKNLGCGTCVSYD